MVSSLWHGLTGLNTYEKALNVATNNSTNVNTVAYKADEVSFEDLMYKNGYGKGTNLKDVNKKITQGSIKLTSNTFDVAISGKGYFILNKRGSEEKFYTRAGNFQMAEDGLLQSANGYKVLGLTPQNNSIISSNPKITQFDERHSKFILSKNVGNDEFLQSINTRSGDYIKLATNTGKSGDNFRTKESLIADIEVLISEYKKQVDTYATNTKKESVDSKAQITTLNFKDNIDELKGENDIIKVRIGLQQISQKFDTDKETTLKKFSDKISQIQGITSSVDIQKGLVIINSLIPGKDIKIISSGINESFSSIENTQIAQLGSGIGAVNSARDALKKQIELANSEFLDIKNTIFFKDEKNLNFNPIQLKLANLELSKNTFGKIEINEGVVFLNDNNNKFLVGKIETASVVNEQGLQALGDNLYQITRESGNPYFAGDYNKLITSSLELSNSNVTESLTQLMVYQRSFEANSRTITTSDELLKTAIELRK